MNRSPNDTLQAAPGAGGFTLTELLVTIAVIGILAALLFPIISSAQARAKRTVCLNNLKQVNSAIHLYAGDNNDRSPDTGNAVYILYKEAVKRYVGLNGPSSPRDKVFACPADTFHYDETSLAYVPKGHHEEADYVFSSYMFNGLNVLTNFHVRQFGVTLPGIAGRPLGSIKDPVKTVLVGESSALLPYSWHAPKAHSDADLPMFNDAKDMVTFADGHVSYIEMYWNSTMSYPDGSPSFAAFYDPPGEFDYKWSGD